jgi:hypothetical protein
MYEVARKKEGSYKNVRGEQKNTSFLQYKRIISVGRYPILTNPMGKSEFNSPHGT